MGGLEGDAVFATSVEHLRARGHRSATLWVLDTNVRARRFYERSGWRPDGARKVENVHGAALEMRYRIDL